MAQLSFPELEEGPLRTLLVELHELRARAGWPSTRELAKGRDFSHAAVHDLMTKTDRLPRLPLLSGVVEAMAETVPRANVEGIYEDFDALWRDCRRHSSRTTGNPWPSQSMIDRLICDLHPDNDQILSDLANGLNERQVAARWGLRVKQVWSIVHRLKDTFDADTLKELVLMTKSHYQNQQANKNLRDDGDRERLTITLATNHEEPEGDEPFERL